MQKRTVKDSKIVKRKKLKRIFHFDYTLVFCLFLIIGFGLIMIYSSSSYTANVEYGDPSYFFNRQLIFVAIGLVLMAAGFMINYNALMRKHWYLLLVSILLLFMLIPFGRTVNGATRWIRLGFFNFQPAELVKLAVIISVVAMIITAGRDIKNFKTRITIILIIGVVPAALVFVISSNLSSALIIFLIVFMMMFIVSPNHKNYLIAIGVAAAIGIVAVIVISNMPADSASFRFNRIAVWLHPEDYELTTGYQTVQSLYAIGSGGFLGKGLGKGLQKLGYIPESQNDMIFAVICEEVGIFGAIILLSIFALLLWRIYVIAMRAPTKTDMLLCMAIFFHISIQLLLNVAVVTNFLPNTGVTLPFISYGGSSMFFLLFEMGLVLNVSKKIDIEEKV
ncbi:MAG: FtsW/RodA/SpoVE family cell cycle protein [Lachnospiraceae bacterium]|nr:FtsW/RodA/SpoVE family cell cycle protein [Lachnospiraceae bacterium]MDY2956357.1 FtsW/RodA/SpoVE family cell cycle protein [Lachnospiraceae bacterium]